MKFQIRPDDFKGKKSRGSSLMEKNLTISIRQQVCLAHPEPLCCDKATGAFYKDKGCWLVSSSVLTWK